MTRSGWNLAVMTMVLTASGALAAVGQEAVQGKAGEQRPQARTVTIAKGDDGWKTVGGGKTQVNLRGFPIRKLFGAALTGSTKVNLKGRPLSPELGDIDTIIQRPEDIVVKGGRGGGPATIAALSLESENPVVIGGKKYSLRVGLSEAEAAPGTIQKPGHLSLSMRGGDGGTLASSLPVQPRLVFTPEGGGQTVAVDCKDIPACARGASPFVLTGQRIAWTVTGGPHNVTPEAAKLQLIKAGITVGDEGFRKYTTIGSSNFMAGISTDLVTGAIAALLAREYSQLMAHGIRPPVATAP